MLPFFYYSQAACVILDILAIHRNLGLVAGVRVVILPVIAGKESDNSFYYVFCLLDEFFKKPILFFQECLKFLKVLLLLIVCGFAF